MVQEKNYTPEQIDDARRLLDTLEKVEESKRSLVVALTMAYMSGIEVGTMYPQDAHKSVQGKIEAAI